MSRRLLFGVGINDSTYKVTKGGSVKYIDGKKVRTPLWTCPIYKKWSSILYRCYSETFHRHRPTYAECSMVIEWHRFSSFHQWMNGQDWHGKELDKDLLYPGNKIYGPDTCMFVSRSVNSFVLDRKAARGELPIGVSWHAQSGKFKATCSNPFSKHKEYLGLFDSATEAYEAWLTRKRELAINLAEKQTDARVAEAISKWYLSGEFSESDTAAQDIP